MSSVRLLSGSANEAIISKSPHTNTRITQSFTYRTIRTTRMVMFLVNWRVQWRRKVNRCQVRQRSGVISNRYLHYSIIMGTRVNTERKPSNNLHTLCLNHFLSPTTHLIPGNRPQDDRGRLLLSMIPIPPLLPVPSPPTIKLICWLL